MSSQVKRIGVLTSGGDAPGMNAAVRGVVRTAVNQGIECVGIRRGWSGLINSDFVQLSGSSVSHIIDKGGTMLYTARSLEFMQHEGREKAIATCKLLGLDGIVAIGGDGTFRGALALSRTRYIADIDDSLVRQIVKYRYEELFSWEEVAAKIGGGNKVGSLQKSLYRYLKKHP